MTEIEHGGNRYRIGKLNAFEQLHVSRKVGPLIPRLVPAFMAMAKDGSAIDQIAQLLEPFAEAFADLSDEAVEYVAGTCLSVVQRQQGTAWAAVWNKQANCLMFDDMDLSSMLPLVIRVITDNLGPFISGLLSGQMQPQTTPAA